MLASRLTDVPGSSQYFKGGSVCYSNELKINDIGVSKDLIERYGAVSRGCKSLAKNIAKKNNTDIGIDKWNSWSRWWNRKKTSWISICWNIL